MTSLSLSQRIKILENNSGTGGSNGPTTVENIENLQSTLDSKQNQLTAGDNITIFNNIISSTNENQPRFLAYYAVAGSVTLNSINNVRYPTVKYNIGGGTYNTSTSTYTVPIEGLYFFNAHWFSRVTHIVDLLKNNVIVRRAETSRVLSGDNVGSFGGVFVECDANDTIRVQCRRGSVRLTYDSTQVATQGWHQFTGYRLCSK